MKWLIALCFLFTACKSKEIEILPADKQADIRTYLETNLDGATLDSLRFIRLDTVTEKFKYLRTIDYISYEVQSINQESADLVDDMKRSAKLRDLTAGLDQTLYSTSKRDVEDGKAKVDANSAKVKALLEKWDDMLKQAEKADSIKPVAYSAVFLYQLRQKDRSVVKDTGYRLLNLDKNVIEEKDFYKY